MSRSPRDPERVGFVGLSHMGLVATAGVASFGLPVTAIDGDAELVERLARRVLPIHEPGLDELVRRHHSRLTYTAEFSALRQCPLVIVTRDVPTDARNESDASVLVDLVDRVVPHLADGACLVLMSQVNPGFTRSTLTRIRQARPEVRCDVVYWVETLVIGNAVERYVTPERIMLGTAEPQDSLPAHLQAFLKCFSCPVLTMGYESAELTKTAINLYLCSAVTFANTLAELCESIGADWTQIVPALGLDRRIGPHAYIRPGLGIAGGNLERDLITLQKLCHRHEVDGTFIDQIVNYNQRRYRWLLRQIEQHVLPRAARPTIAMWGLAYKKDTRSTKNSFALRIIADLRDRANIRAYDPMAEIAPSELGITRVDDPYEALRGADAVAIVTDWDQFARPDAARMAALMAVPLVIDCVGVLQDEPMRSAPVTVVRMGRAIRPAVAVANGGTI